MFDRCSRSLAQDAAQFEALRGVEGGDIRCGSTHCRDGISHRSERQRGFVCETWSITGSPPG